MKPAAMEPYGRALQTFLEGGRSAQLVVRRDDGVESVIPVAHFFRDEPDLTEIETRAIELCTGRVLDVGSGAGSLSIVLQRRSCSVTAIDISPEAVDVATRRGVTHALCADIFAFEGGPFDTLLMMGHGIGMVETIEGLTHFLKHARSLITAGGQLLLDSLDVRVTEDLANLAYQEANRAAGRYIGEIVMLFAFEGSTGPLCGWLHVDPETLRKHAESTGWTMGILHGEDSGEYLARLVPQKRA
jgi:SAM-dependent methyltransferase